MIDPFDTLDRVLFAAPQSVTITYLPRNGDPVSGVSALLEDLDELAQLGGSPVEQHVQGFRVRKSQLPAQPRDGDVVDHAGARWRVAGLGQTDSRGKHWTFNAARQRDR